MRFDPGRSGGGARGPFTALLTALALATVAWAASAQTDFPNIPVWSYPGVWHAGVGRDTIEARPRTITVRWLRDPASEARPDFGGYRIYRGTNIGGICDTASLVLVRRFSTQVDQKAFTWHFPDIDGSTPESGRIAMFVDPDSAGRFTKVRRPDDDPCRRQVPACYDSMLVLVPPPGPHDGFRTFYSIAYEALNTSFKDYQDMFVPGAIETRSDVAADRGPVAVAAGDMDGDGLVDLVTANQDGNTASIHPGRAAANCLAAGFGPRRDIPTVLGPRAVAVADINQDRLMDLVVAAGGSDSVAVFLGAGGGVLSPAPTIVLGGHPTAIAVGDIDGDSQPDLVATIGSPPSIALWLGNDDGTFVSGGNVPISVAPTSLALGDLDGDRKLDLVVASASDGAVVWRLGNGDGAFGPENSSSNHPGARAVAIIDVVVKSDSRHAATANADARADLVIANGLANTLSVLRGNGDGTFDERRDYDAGSGPASVCAVDLNGDARLDLAVADASGGTVSILRRGADSLSFQPRTEMTLGGRPVSMAAADLSQEGLLDLAVADSAADSVKVIFGPSNLNHKASNVSNDAWYPSADPNAFPDDRYFAHPVQPSGGPTPDLARVAVVPNPYRAVEAWNPAGSQELHFINLPTDARIQIYTLSGDLVKEIHHTVPDPATNPGTPWDQLRDFEAWDLKNGSGRDVASGIYIYRVEAKNFSHQSRFIVIR